MSSTHAILSLTHTSCKSRRWCCDRSTSCSRGPPFLVSCLIHMQHPPHAPIERPPPMPHPPTQHPPPNIHTPHPTSTTQHAPTPHPPRNIHASPPTQHPPTPPRITTHTTTQHPPTPPRNIHHMNHPPPAPCTQHNMSGTRRPPSYIQWRCVFFNCAQQLAITCLRAPPHPAVLVLHTKLNLHKREQISGNFQKMP